MSKLQTLEYNLSFIERYIINKSCNLVINNEMFNFDKDNFELCALNNQYKLFINKFNYSDFSINDRSDLCNKYVVYLIYTEDGVYIGQTKDFNERMHSHLKDVSDTDRNLYESLRKRKIGVINILHVFDENSDDDIGRTIEKIYLNELVTIRENYDYLKNHIFNVLR